MPGQITDIRTHNDYNNDYILNNDSNNDYDNYESDNITKTKTNICISDHSILTCTYNSKFLKIPQLVKIIRDNSKISSKKLVQLFNNNKILPHILESNDSNYIAETLVNELSIMVETLAPSKLIQCNKKLAP